MKASVTKRTKVFLLALLLIVAIFVIGVLIYQKYNTSSHYTLVGDDYSVIVTKKQFEQYGQGEFSNMNLDQYVEHNHLLKIYHDDIEGAAEKGLKIRTPSEKPPC